MLTGDRHAAADRRLAELVAMGRTSAQIAERLGVAPGVARYRLRKAMERAGADTAPEFAARVLPGRNVPGVDLCAA
jgi:DNA-binding CsgD family transcriptional regulator